MRSGVEGQKMAYYLWKLGALGYTSGVEGQEMAYDL